MVFLHILPREPCWQDYVLVGRRVFLLLWGLPFSSLFFFLIERVWLACCPVGVYRNLKRVYS